MLGVYPLTGNPIPGTSRTAFQIEATVLECRVKEGRQKALLDMGSYHTDPGRLIPLLPDMKLTGFSSAYSVYDVEDCPEKLQEGSAVRFGLTYSSLSRALASQALPCVLL